MKDRDYDDGGWFVEEDMCLGCGDIHYRASRIAGICVECASGDSDRDDFSDGYEKNPYGFGSN